MSGYYQVNTAKELLWLTTAANMVTITSEGYGIKTINDIDMTGKVVDGIATFSKIFDGNNKKIKGITISGTDYVAFISTLNARGVVKDLTLENANITGVLRIGGIVGDNKGIIIFCYNNASINGNYAVGGVAGLNDGGTIERCYNISSVTGYYAGGIVGLLNNGVIKSSYNAGAINATTIAGGIVGHNQVNGEIKNCYNIGIVKGTTAAGIAGNSWTKVENCYNIGSVIGTSNVGGVIGSGSSIGGTVTSCYYLTGSAGIGNNGIGANNIDDPAKTKALSSINFGTQSEFSTAPSNWDFSTVWEMGSSLAKAPAARPVLKGGGSGNNR